ncbi:sulfite exporter TauE/SafE family protein [Streptomyces sp. NPDC048639]|uniref:sulfite exporter TauE/SafE family protein n=1 Tax=Streptomyces sp. NPDC048639 TaxID=3365581 RepID=UPI00371AE1D3
MGIWEALAVFAAGIAAGTINTIVGSGTLITFPVLLAVGLPPVTANVSNSLGIVPGSIGGAIGYRRELRGQRSRVLRLGVVALIGGLIGAALLIVLPSDAFDTIVPVLVGLAVVLVAVQPWLARAVQRHLARRATADATDTAAPAGAHSDGASRESTPGEVTAGDDTPGDGPPGDGAADQPGARPRRGDRSPVLLLGLLLASAYGGYFGAAQGILYLSMMGLLLDENLQRLNAVKNVLAALVNAVAALFFLFVADFDWTAVLLIAAGSALGGPLGATVGRRLPPAALRAIVVVVGVVAMVRLLLT